MILFYFFLGPQFGYTGFIVTWTVINTGDYQILANGAQVYCAIGIYKFSEVFDVV